MGNDRISIMHRVTMETLEDIKSNMQSVAPGRSKKSDYGKCPWCCEIGKCES